MKHLLLGIFLFVSILANVWVLSWKRSAKHISLHDDFSFSLEVFFCWGWECWWFYPYFLATARMNMVRTGVSTDHYTEHYTIHGLLSKLHTLHCTIKQSTLYTEQFILNTPNHTLNTTHYTMHTAHYTLHTDPCTLQWSAVYWTLF